MASSPEQWEFWIDRGGTFTDCIGRAPDGALHTAKVLSSDSAPIEGIQCILARCGLWREGEALPVCAVKLGSTVATNALLERRGMPTVLVGPAGLIDVFTIGTQERPELFELDIRRTPTLHCAAVEVTGRLSADGEEVVPLDLVAIARDLAHARAAGARVAAIVLMHAYANPEQEAQVARLAAEAGFEYVAASSEIAREIGLLARGETTAADAYLTPLLRAHVERLATALPGSRLRFMQSSGGLTEASRFRGPGALLSGPAGGVVAAARVAAAAGESRAIGFDMGGTSTDVSLIVDGEVERAFETRVGGVRVKSPMLRIHTVAAGGGSLCRFDGFTLTVGPESAGADPGPLCYGLLDESGEVRARELAVTDINLYLGRLQPDRFPFDLSRGAVERGIEVMRERLAEAGIDRDPDDVAAGFAEVANDSMAQAIVQVSVARGVDPRDCALVGFGGAGGQHVCAIARLLGMRTILLHPLAGLLSAQGIGIAEVTWDGQRDAGRAPLPARDGAGVADGPEPLALPERLLRAFGELEEEGIRALVHEGFAPERVRLERWLDLRYAGTDTSLPVRLAEPWDAGSVSPAAAFEEEHRRRFGYVREDRALEIVTVRVRARGPGGESPRRASTSSMPTGASVALRTERVWCPGAGRVETPVYARESLVPGSELRGPAVILEDTGTVVIDPGFHVRVDGDGVLVIRDAQPGAAAAPGPTASEEAPAEADPVRLEVFGNRFMSIAEQMGAVLRNTAFSTNIKERLDYSCAVFDGGGGLVANAPHIPVHLGAMAETVKAVLERFRDLAEGDMVVTNDPFEGGSHLPDVTLVTPVFLSGASGDSRSPRFFVASRGHHAEIGGKTPGSMPPDSSSLEEEGVVLHAFRLVQAGRFDEARLRQLLAAGRYPSRRPDDNVADLVAMVAANRAGERLLQGFVAEQGAGRVRTTMSQLQQAAASKVSREIGRLANGRHRFEDSLDDGTPIVVELDVEGERLRIDFTGTGPATSGNLNAPRAVVQAAVLYVLRCLVEERIPLNGGCLEPVEIHVPAGSILDPPPGSAVVGGNVETSQRVVDVLLGALGVAAASQGTMNNVTFGDASFGYYETIGGGAGAGPGFDGASGVHTHMTNTRITDPEVLEARYPVRLVEFALHPGSGGAGRHRGGDGLIRGYEFLSPVTVTLLTERRTTRPFGLAGGESGRAGRNTVCRRGRDEDLLPSKCSVELGPGDRLRIETPGGGGYGAPSVERS